MTAADPELLRLRDSIDNIDAALIYLLAERFKCTQAVGEFKATHGLPPADPAREAGPDCAPPVAGPGCQAGSRFRGTVPGLYRARKSFAITRRSGPPASSLPRGKAWTSPFRLRKKPSGKRCGTSLPRPNRSCRKIWGRRNKRDCPSDEYLIWHQLLYKKGWVAPAWPKELGGAGWSVTQRYIFATETAQGQHAHHLALRPRHGRTGDLHFRQRGAEKEIPAPHSFRRGLVVPGLFRARRGIGSWRRCAAGRCAKATTMSSMARRPGPRWRNMPTGSSVWCAPIPMPSPRKASPSC